MGSGGAKVICEITAGAWDGVERHLHPGWTYRKRESPDL